MDYDCVFGGVFVTEVFFSVRGVELANCFCHLLYAMVQFFLDGLKSPKEVVGVFSRFLLGRLALGECREAFDAERLDDTLECFVLKEAGRCQPPLDDFVLSDVVVIRLAR